MATRFIKMHGAGNDFVVFDARRAPVALPEARIRALADRRTGIGWDQLILLEPATDPSADLLMHIYNPDGSVAQACGNATRCVASLLAGEGGGARVTIQTAARLLACTVAGPDSVTVDMGAPLLGWRDIPLGRATDTLRLDLPGEPAAASMGNPHATFFVDDIDAIDPAALGPALERDPLFPERANIGWAQVLAPDRIRLRVWERGAGLTRACGSGACAALVNAHRRGLAGRRAWLALDGGTLLIEWRGDGHVLMSGPAVQVFCGAVDLAE